MCCNTLIAHSQPNNFAHLIRYNLEQTFLLSYHEHDHYSLPAVSSTMPRSYYAVPGDSEPPRRGGLRSVWGVHCWDTKTPPGSPTNAGDVKIQTNSQKTEFI